MVCTYSPFLPYWWYTLFVIHLLTHSDGWAGTLGTTWGSMSPRLAIRFGTLHYIIPHSSRNPLRLAIAAARIVSRSTRTSTNHGNTNKPFRRNTDLHIKHPKQQKTPHSQPPWNHLALSTTKNSQIQHEHLYRHVSQKMFVGCKGVPTFFPKPVP